MSTEHVQKKEKIVKSLAIIGFFATICIIAWLAVLVVNLVPSAFTSLASLAEGIKQYQESVTEEETLANIPLSLDSTMIESGKPLIVSWVKDRHPGTYVFSFNCVDAITLELLQADGLRTLECATSYDVGDTDTLTVIIESSTTTVVSLLLTITYHDTVDSPAVRNGEVLAQVSNLNFLAQETPPTLEPTVEGTSTSTQVVATGTPSVIVRSPEYEYTYTIPVSNPSGIADLQARFLNIGEIRNNNFRAKTPRQDSTAAVQFEIKNIGTKTSDDWTFKFTASGDTYESKKQAALKPNERAVISLSFDTTHQSRQTIKVDVEVRDERNANNNSFSQTLTVID